MIFITISIVYFTRFGLDFTALGLLSFFAFIISKVAKSFNLTWEFIVPIWGIIVSVSVSMLIGVIFGVFPARNASRLNPIEALNKE